MKRGMLMPTPRENHDLTEIGRESPRLQPWDESPEILGLLNRQEAVHFSHIAARINVFSPALLHLAGFSLKRAVVLLWGEAQSQARARSLEDVFFLGAVFLVLAVPFALTSTRQWEYHGGGLCGWRGRHVRANPYVIPLRLPSTG